MDLTKIAEEALADGGILEEDRGYDFTELEAAPPDTVSADLDDDERIDLKGVAESALRQAELDFPDTGSDAKAEAKAETAAGDFPGTITENPDGTVTYSVLVQFDPKVQKEMAKAMPKGIKREDLADDLGEPGGDEEDGADKDEAAFIEGEVGVAEDASPSRHAQTPLENCRAKDPMFCPYHGDKAIKKAIEDNLVKAGYSTFTVYVTPDGKGRYAISVVAPSGTSSNAMGVAIQLPFSNGTGGYKKGVTLHASLSSPTARVEIDKDADPDRDVSMLDEWLDDLMLDIDADQTLLQELDPKDMVGLLESRDALENTPKQLNGQDNPAYAAALKDAQDKYHALRAQIDFSPIKSQTDAQAEETRLDGIYNQLGNDYLAAATPARDAKKAIFPGGKFPRGFKAAHPWADKFGKADMNVFFAQRDYTNADNELQQAFPNDVKRMRNALGQMQNARDRYEAAVEAYKDAVPEFLKELEDWAKNDPSITPAQLQQAFPNSQSGASAPAAPASQTASAPAPAAPQRQTSTGNVTLPQSWNNFVMGANKVLPTDGISDLPYGRDQDFALAFDGAFPKQSVQDVIESFAIGPTTGYVSFVLNPKVSANEAAYFVNALDGAGYVGVSHGSIPHHSGGTAETILIPFNALRAGK